MNLAEISKRQSDRTWLSQLSDPTAVAVTTDPGDGSGTGSTDPVTYVEQLQSSPNPYPQYSVQRFEFFNATEWDVAHNTGDDPLVTIWQYPQIEGFGFAAFGTSFFGGSLGPVNANTQTPAITRIDENNFKVTWQNPASGKAVVYG